MRCDMQFLEQGEGTGFRACVLCWVEIGEGERVDILGEGEGSVTLPLQPTIASVLLRSASLTLFVRCLFCRRLHPREQFCLSLRRLARLVEARAFVSHEPSRYASCPEGSIGVADVGFGPETA